MARQARLVSLLCGVGVMALTAPAYGQDASGEVVVTGSRIARTTFQTPTPVTAVTEKELEAKAATTVIDLLRDIPALRPNQTVGSGRNIGVSNFNMRSLGSSRTLVLLDGQRLMDTSPVGGFDLNVIPAPLVSRMDIVTAGASSVYGSDAITGVVNVVLNNTLQGGKLDAQYKNTEEGDKQTATASVVFGTGFANDKGRVLVAASYFDSPDILYQGARDWGAQGYTLVPNAAYTPTNGQFRQLIVPNVRLSQMTFGGVITSPGALRNTQFGVNGAQSTFQQGTNVGTIWMQGGAGPMPQPDLGVLAVKARQTSVFTRFMYDFTPSVRGRIDFLGTNSRNGTINNYNYNNADITIRRDNPFLPANILASMITNNLQTITVGRLNPETGINTNSTNNDYYRGAASLSGDFLEGWTWEVGGSYTYGLTDNRGRNNRIQANWTNALDVVSGPNGPICRSTLTNPTNGCVPANIFGINSVSAAAVAYVVGTSYQRSHSRSLNLSANVSGPLGATWAGPIQVAGGVEYRDDRINNKSDPISDINGWRQGTYASYRGQVDVKEVYGEASLPLLADSPLAQSLTLDLAGRYVDYSSSGGAEVWKTGLNWTVNDQIRFRGTYSKDFRAPKIDDLYSAASFRAGTPVIVNNTNVNVNTISGGNPNLKPEIAHTTTFGVVLSPSFIPGLQLSADYFDIELEDALTLFTAQQVVDRCAAGDAQFCAGIQRNASGVITTVLTSQFNAQLLQTSGIDMEASYALPLDSVVSGWSGDMQFRSVLTYTDKRVTSTPGGTTIDTAGQVAGAGTPHWRSSTTIGYSNGPLNLRALFNYVGEGTIDNTFGPLDISDNQYPAYVYVDLSAQYDLTERLQLYAKVENLLDKDPPIIPNNTIVIASTSAANFYDLLGRTYAVGVRYRW